MSLLLPDRHLRVNDSLALQSARLFERLEVANTVGAAWAVYKELFPDFPFARFVLALDVLIALGVLRFDDQLLTKEATDAA